MHKITSINNTTNEIEITHSSGAKHKFVIPETERTDEMSKILHIKKQMNLHNMRLEQVKITPPITAKINNQTEELLATIKLLHTILAVESILLILACIGLLHHV